jgi:sarcosine oxidase subunit alpha
VTFTFGDRTITARAGQSIAAALYAAGQRVFSRSFKYHRPRGLFCVAGECPNCLMEVDGRPNVRTCTEPVRAGQMVRHQNAWPSLEFDLMRTFDRFDRLLPVGFYYKRFHKPRWLWPLFEHTVRHLAGNGRVDVHAMPNLEVDVEHLHAEVCVVGGGPAGLAAAAEAAAAGAQVLLLERLPALGGHLLFAGDAANRAAPLITAVTDQPNVVVRFETTAFGLYEGNLLGAFSGKRLLKIRARHVLVCTGGRERPFVFHNNDLPGVFLSRGVQRLGRLYGVPAGRRAVIVTDHDGGQHIAAEIEQLGIEVAALIDPRPAAKNSESDRWPVYRHSAIVAANGGSCLSGVNVAEIAADGTVRRDTRQTIDCDLVCSASALIPANELLLQGGVRFQPQNGRWQITRQVAGLSAAGAAAGTLDVEAQIAEGRLRGAEAAAALGHRVPALDELRHQWESLARLGAADGFGCVLPADGRTRKRFVCLCEDVTEKDLEQAVAEGFDEIEMLKRYSTVNMGPCQGKVCGQTAAEICGRLTCRDLAAVGTTTSRPPATPVELRLLAAARTHPVRRTPMHHWHARAGARWLDAGLWKRPEHYGDPAGEVAAIRTVAGLIDVSTLGKLEVVGPDAAELLERVYTNRWRDLAAGRVRYGIMCNEDGILFDDGVGARLAADRYYLTATTGNADAVFQWLELWQATWRLNAAILNHTSAYAGISLAGPKAREVLRRLTSLDLSTASFPYLGLREATVAGIPCRLLRIGFVGELGYEIHCPSRFGLHLWEALMEAGKPAGCRPCGVEAQRVLRLEKGHLIFGADTDALSNPLEAGLEWAVRFDKPLFHGREPLQRLKAMGARSRLVGFVMEEKHLVSSEGCQVVADGKSVGRVTSARFSPTLGQSIGLAWLPAAAAKEGERFLIRWNGTDRAARVARTPFYDPQGRRMKA